jgi:hypothetical protein
MGWNSFPGFKDRWTEKEMKDLFDEDWPQGYKTLESVIVSEPALRSVYYAAVQKPDGSVFASIVLIEKIFKQLYKNVDENHGPRVFDCPLSILDRLSPTENEYALNWRKRCRNVALSRRKASERGGSYAY